VRSDILFSGRLYASESSDTEWFSSYGIDRVVLSSGQFSDGTTEFYIEESDDAENVRFVTGPLNYPWIDAQGNTRPYGDGFKREWSPAYAYFRVHTVASNFAEFAIRAIPY
jgi:hypothetical protein